MEKETSCINSRAILDYVKEQNNGDCSGLLGKLDPEIDALHDPEDFLRDPNNWISSGMISKLFERARWILHDEMAPFKIARFAVENLSFGYVQGTLIKALGSTNRVINNLQRLNDRWNRTRRVELVELKRNSAVVRQHWLPGMGSTKDVCQFTKGVYIFMPVVWGGSALNLEEKYCRFEDAPYCEYHLKWPVRNFFHEVFFRFFGSRKVLMETIKEIDEGKKLIQRKSQEVDELTVELKNSHAMLSRSEQLSSFGNLAAGITHELKNPMTSINTFLQLFPTKYEDEEFRTRFHKIALEETSRMNNLITELLDLVKAKESHFEAHDLNELIGKMVFFISLQSKAKRIEVTGKFDPTIQNVIMDSNKMKQVILNFLQNALEITPERGIIEILTRKMNSSEKRAGVEIEIRDNGPGIHESVIDKIFDPYFTTKNDGGQTRGIGLGLFIARQIMQDHGGSIEVKSRVGEGTQFILYLPSNPPNRGDCE